MYQLEMPKETQTVSIIAYVHSHNKEYAVRLSKDCVFQIFDEGKKIFQTHIKYSSYNKETLQRAVDYVFPKFHI